MSITLPLTKGKVAIIDDIDADLAQFKWRARRASRSKDLYYAARSVMHKDRTFTHYDLHRVIGDRMGFTDQVDHIDRDGLNNRRDNLRNATRRQNNANQPPLRTSKSGIKGVRWSPHWQRWVAKFGIARGKFRYLGSFKTKEEAGRRYDQEAIKEYGEFAWLNFPERALEGKEGK